MIRQSSMSIKLDSLSSITEAQQHDNHQTLVRLRSHKVVAAGLEQDGETSMLDGISVKDKAVESSNNAPRENSTKVHTETTSEPSFTQCRLACSCIYHRS